MIKFMGTQPGVGNPEAGGFHPEYMDQPVEITMKGPDGVRSFRSVKEMLDTLKEENANRDRWN